VLVADEAYRARKIEIVGVAGACGVKQ
jgi:hypothetical protein